MRLIRGRRFPTLLPAAGKWRESDRWRSPTPNSCRCSSSTGTRSSAWTSTASCSAYACSRPAHPRRQSRTGAGVDLRDSQRPRDLLAAKPKARGSTSSGRSSASTATRAPGCRERPATRRTWVSRCRACYLQSRAHERCQMHEALRSTRPNATSAARASRRVGSRPPTRRVAVSLSQRSCSEWRSSGLPTSAPITACWRRSSLPEGWLLGLLLLALTSALLPGAFVPDPAIVALQFGPSRSDPRPSLASPRDARGGDRRGGTPRERFARS